MLNIAIQKKVVSNISLQIFSHVLETRIIILEELYYKISNDTHIWNLVYLNGVWSHLDATWDDPISKFNENRDTYFLINYDELVNLDDNTHSFDKTI